MSILGNMIVAGASLLGQANQPPLMVPAKDEQAKATIQEDAPIFDPAIISTPEPATEGLRFVPVGPKKPKTEVKAPKIPPPPLEAGKEATPKNSALSADLTALSQKVNDLSGKEIHQELDQIIANYGIYCSNDESSATTKLEAIAHKAGVEIQVPKHATEKQLRAATRISLRKIVAEANKKINDKADPYAKLPPAQRLQAELEALGKLVGIEVPKQGQITAAQFNAKLVNLAQAVENSAANAQARLARQISTTNVFGDPYGSIFEALDLIEASIDPENKVSPIFDASKEVDVIDNPFTPWIDETEANNASVFTNTAIALRGFRERLSVQLKNPVDDTADTSPFQREQTIIR